ncbi:MAG: hypothetical protein Q9170_007048 [Blastenia crenularia]
MTTGRINQGRRALAPDLGGVRARSRVGREVIQLPPLSSPRAGPPQSPRRPVAGGGGSVACSPREEDAGGRSRRAHGGPGGYRPRLAPRRLTKSLATGQSSTDLNIAQGSGPLGRRKPPPRPERVSRLGLRRVVVQVRTGGRGFGGGPAPAGGRPSATQVGYWVARMRRLIEELKPCGPVPGGASARLSAARGAHRRRA